ncbi:MAG: alpha/beta fold hydrolase [Candidatus Eisenbacteria bacterium]
MKNFLVLALSALLLFGAGTAWLLLYPAVPRDLGGAPDLDAHATRVRIAVAEGDSLDAWVLPGTRPGVIVAFHGYARNHARVWRYAQFLRQDGWTIVAPDFRSSRAKDRKPTTLGAYEVEDADAVLRWVASQPRLASQPLGLFGESLGASAALVVAARDDDVRVVVADCPFANGRLAIEDGCVCEGHVPVVPFAALTRAIGRVVTGHDPAALDVEAAVRAYGDRPLFLVQAGVEDRFRIPQTRLLENAAGANTEGWRVMDAGHNQAWVKHRTEYERRVRSFFREFLHERGTVVLQAR